MSAEKPGSRVLIAEADDLLCEKLRAQFADSGYHVVAVRTGKECVEQAQNAYPGLILLALNLPDAAGPAVFRQLRQLPRTAHVPIMILAGRDETALYKTLLEEGAYDVIEKPIDIDILVLRVRNALRRAEREGLTEARTGLPTGRLIDERLTLLATQQGWYRITLTIAEFDAFRDQYGFVTANEALRFAGSLILQLVGKGGSPGDFVGHHANSETFVIITSVAHGPRLRDALVERLTHELQSFYNFVDREQGYVLVSTDGGTVQMPLMSAIVEVEQDPASLATLPREDDPWVDAHDDETSGPASQDAASGNAFEW